VLYGRDFWEPMFAFFRTKMLAEYKTISEDDLSIMHIVDSVDEALEYILAHVDCDDINQV
jgi:predicted Rossmann-fold nucleotide-binding protein